MLKKIIVKGATNYIHLYDTSRDFVTLIVVWCQLIFSIMIGIVGNAHKVIEANYKLSTHVLSIIETPAVNYVLTFILSLHHKFPT